VPDVRKNIDVLIRAKDETQSGVRTADAALSSFNKTTLALGISAAGVALGIRTMANEMDQLSKTARQLGATTDEVQQLTYAARIMDVEFSALSNSVVELQRRLDDPTIAIALSRIGLRMEDIRDQSPAVALEKVTAALGRMESQTIRAATAYELFGRQGREILAVDSKELLRLMGDAPVIPRESIEEIGRFGDEWDKLEMNAKAAAATIAGPVISAVNGLIELLDRGRRAGSWLADLMPWATGGAWGGRTGHMGRPRMLTGNLEMVPGLGMVPTETSPIFSDINQPTQDRLRAVREELRRAHLALSVRGSMIGGASMRPGGSIRGMEFAGPVGMFPTSAEEEKQNKALEERVGHLADLRDSYDALRDGIREVEIQAESLGATLVDGAFRWADSWSRGMALVQTKQAEFADIGKRLFRAMVTDMLAWINRLIARQIVSAVLSSILGGGGNVAGAIQAATAAAGGGGGAVPMGLPESSRAFRPPQVATGDFSRPVIVQASISTVFGSQSEVRAAASHLKRVMEQV